PDSRERAKHVVDVRPRGIRSDRQRCRREQRETRDPSPEIEATARQEVDGGETRGHLEKTAVEARGHRAARRTRLGRREPASEPTPRQPSATPDGTTRGGTRAGPVGCWAADGIARELERRPPPPAAMRQGAGANGGAQAG